MDWTFVLIIVVFHVEDNTLRKKYNIWLVALAEYKESDLANFYKVVKWIHYIGCDSYYYSFDRC